MKEVIDFYTKNPVGCLATVENGKPRVRPFQFLFADGGKLYFCTANTKDVFKQLTANPSVEFAATSPEYVFMRVSGDVKFSRDAKIKKRILDTFAMIRGIYQTPENPVFEVFFIEHGTVKIADLSGNPARFVKF
ncbi:MULTISPECIES: pyridoxamine 5'-phosphate oxidase family protein [unclassified Methanoregula]|uniref:pyridoxamine 5'-phosphate oxidase family protein n=1 Tax=unclassified Methanoregula TaxID=2649730 RepID=UPI0009D407E1|nr:MULTISPECIES: pyridoxamine 5'-phosphate oxidase family protein [unclassified Methanoregula]OPX62293.1 MAG: Pyridoxamine 5'-phosphate oxidase [Methanoregula sp. PtaB.Bin085]OPY32720.1 MAG: Pyridoxamine 5'-phosphate oxidase [Methanoregula sp. PtaU1.Bin006]